MTINIDKTCSYYHPSKATAMHDPLHQLLPQLSPLWLSVCQKSPSNIWYFWCPRPPLCTPLTNWHQWTLTFLTVFTAHTTLPLTWKGQNGGQVANSPHQRILSPTRKPKATSKILPLTYAQQPLSASSSWIHAQMLGHFLPWRNKGDGPGQQKEFFSSLPMYNSLWSHQCHLAPKHHPQEHQAAHLLVTSAPLPQPSPYYCKTLLLAPPAVKLIQVTSDLITPAPAIWANLA